METLRDPCFLLYMFIFYRGGFIPLCAVLRFDLKFLLAKEILFSEEVIGGHSFLLLTC